MTIRLWLALVIGTCGGYLLIVPARTEVTIAAGIGFIVTAVALIVDHKY
jgi:hypothetical protein